MNYWMVRAGEKGRLADEFAKGYVAIGWHVMGDMSGIATQDEMRDLYEKTHPDAKPGLVGNAAAMAFKFCKTMEKGDKVISYDKTSREYMVGEITSNYRYAPDVVEDYPNIREVKWQGKVSRDRLSVPTKNSLGSVLTLFSLNEDVWNEIQQALVGKVEEVGTDDNEMDDSELLDNIKEQSREFIKDKINRLGPYELQDLVAGVLRAMGYKTQVSEPGPDRGVDIFASPDGFGFEQPRIFVECKHRKASMGPNEIRSFLGGRHKDDKGLYVSTGGFTQEAKYEAERASIPITLMDMDKLVDAVLEHYENFDTETRVLLPLAKVYWPA